MLNFGVDDANEVQCTHGCVQLDNVYAYDMEYNVSHMHKCLRVDVHAWCVLTCALVRTCRP
eukprot:m.330107 g.330107  ORF g.330107 m.330107 type:complete len:61 (+) comp20456_c1_seq1:495-677(+)